MVEKFKQKQGHEMGNRKRIKINLAHQHKVDEDINLQKVGGERKT
jgi:hypothetical protein